MSQYHSGPVQSTKQSKLPLASLYTVYLLMATLVLAADKAAENPQRRDQNRWKQRPPQSRVLILVRLPSLSLRWTFIANTCLSISAPLSCTS
ncbi:hypothetical protein BD769DRAFT_1439442 [Suillus cothurnatus]|nr:hypothetical protein BD769DRAFT_1439442 [Suillus cothurnatus]